MHGNLLAQGAASRKATAVTDSESTVGCDSEENDWFGAIARGLLGKDAGYGLHITTGAPEGSCYKYVTTNPMQRRQPPGTLIRDLLRTNGGWSWLNAIMGDSQAEWWVDLQRTKRIADAIASVE